MPLRCPYSVLTGVAHAERAGQADADFVANANLEQTNWRHIGSRRRYRPTTSCSVVLRRPSAQRVTQSFRISFWLLNINCCTLHWICYYGRAEIRGAFWPSRWRRPRDDLDQHSGAEQDRPFCQIGLSVSAAIGAAIGRYPPVISIVVENAPVLPACIWLAPRVLLLPLLVLFLLVGL